jgi:predicted RNA-binding protein (virulence factor B family)
VNSILRFFLIAGLLVAEPLREGLAVEVQTQPAPELSCKVGSFVKSELYFGLSKPGRGRVTEAEWQQFLNRMVTPRLREGLTVINAYGQYLNRSGSLVIESSKLLILVHESSKDREQSIAEIITAYKKTFNQESVLRVTSCIQATFD